MTAGQALAVAVTVLVLALAYAGMWRGWRRRARRQGDLPDLPAPPDAPGTTRLAWVEGVYVGTTTAGDWLDRVVVHSLGRRSPARVHVSDAGVTIERGPEPTLFVPAAAVLDARLDRALAGRVVEDGGLVVLTWEHGGHRLDTAVRPRRAGDTRPLRDALNGLRSRGRAA